MVIPLYDRNPVRRTPYVTYLLIAINLAVFLIGPAASGLLTHTGTAAPLCAQQQYFLHWGAVPRELLSNHALTAGALPVATITNATGAITTCVLAATPGKIPFLSVLTGMFVHVGWLHVLGNMLFLYVFGNNVEDRLGRVHFALFYLAGGYLATYAYALADPGSSTCLVGASGAIAAVLGAYLVMYPRAKVTSVSPLLMFLPLRIPAWLILAFWFAIQVPAVLRVLHQPVDGTVGYAAHLAGFTAGTVYALALVIRARLGRRAADYARAQCAESYEPTMPA